MESVTASNALCYILNIIIANISLPSADNTNGGDSVKSVETTVEEQNTKFSIGNANYNISRWYSNEKPLNDVVAEEITSETSESHN